MVGAEQAQRIYVQIALGTAKADYPWPLDDEASAFWDQVEAEVTAIRKRGDDLEIAEVTEIPDLPPWVKEAPGAEPPPPPGEDSGSTPTATAETEPLHLPGKHNQKDHGHRRNRGAPAGGKAPAKPAGGGSGGGGGGTAGGKSYADPAAAKKFLDDHYSQWKKKDLSDAEYAGLSFYQSPGFALMNGQLRGLKKGDIKADMSFGDADLKRAKTASTNLTKGIGKAPPLPHAVQVHRGFDAAQFGDLSPGMTVTDKGFVSTSLTSSGVASVGKAAKPGRMRMELPAGTKAGAGSARELILPPGSSFEILGVSQEGGTTVVDTRLVGGGG